MRLQIGVFVLLLAVVAPQFVFGAATIADVYNAPSEAIRYTGTTNATCQNGNTLYLCADSQFPTLADSYTVLGDGSTSAASGASFQDKDNTQTSFLKLVYDLEGLLSGTYYLRFAINADSTFTYTVCAYLEDDENVNTSSCVNLTHTAGDGSAWVEGSIDSVVRESSERFNNRVILRLIATNNYAVTTTETYLKRPFKPADFSIVPGGASEAEIDTRIRNVWSIVSVVEVPEITNGSCQVRRLENISEIPDYKDLNMSELDVEYVVGDDNSFFAVYWDADDAAQYMEEGFNYEVVCEGYLGDLFMQGWSQFVYINREKSLVLYLLELWEKILQIIGITEDTQQLVSGQAEMVDAQAGAGESVYLTTFLTYADGTVDENASCYVDVWYPNSTQWIAGQGMVAAGSAGRYTYQVSVPGEIGLYQMRSFCNGTALANRTRYAYGNLEVFDDVYMQMVT